MALKILVGLGIIALFVLLVIRALAIVKLAQVIREIQESKR